MVRVLILEGNTPAWLTSGPAGAACFVSTFQRLDPKLSLQILNPYQRAVSPGDFDAVDAVVFTGSGEAWAADAPETACQREAMELALAAGRPIWGSCNGMNLAAVVLGGSVGPNPNGIEVGLAENLQLTEAGEIHPMMAGRAPGFAVPCIHRDHVLQLPSQAQLLAYNAHTAVQAFAMDAGGADIWATQYHPEASLDDIAAYVRHQGIFDHLGEAMGLLKARHIDFEARSSELANWVRYVKQRSQPQTPQRQGETPAAT
ncbi:MAG: type 1 glutamine amidotransferase [Pseudomonadota bacterium]